MENFKVKTDTLTAELKTGPDIKNMKINIQFESGQIEGVLNASKNNRGVIITHPHPEYGGNMDNGVVLTMEKAYLDIGYTTLRFNFRGTGNSTGTYSTFCDLCDDLVTAHSYLADLEISDIALAGYSFGSWVNAHADVKLKGLLHHQLLVSPPVSFMDFSQVSGFSCDSFVICGDRDEYAALLELKRHLKLWNAGSFKTIKVCDHFYSGKYDLLGHAMENMIL